MRLLSDDGVPIGSIAVAPNPAAPYDERDEELLDALGDRVSSTVHRLSLFEAVRTEQRTLSDILASTSDGIFSVGPDGRVRAWNPGMEEITGTSPATAVGQSCCSVFRPVDADGRALHGAACPCRRGEPLDVLSTIDVDGRPRWLGCVYSPMPDGGSVVVVRDVTARKQIEDEKADFLATVSHELRTPLTPLKGFLQTLLRSDVDLPKDDRAHIYEVMLREEQRLERLVDQLLQATTVDLTTTPLAVAPLDWEQLVALHVDECRRLDPSREVSLLVEPGLPLVLAEEAKAAGILLCLLSNAVKYTPPGSPIGVAVAADGDRVVTTVADHGPGVPTADRERIFDKFIRLGDHLTRPQQGVGLGLYIARRDVEAMGGTVWVEDAAGGGAAFSFSLPLAPSAPRPEGHGAAALRASAS